MVISLRDVLDDPPRCCRVIEDDLFGVTVETLRTPNYGGVILDLGFAALPELAVASYGRERARVSIRPDGGIYSFPRGADRQWKHRNPSPLGPGFGHLAGELCLYYPLDPRGLRWEWGDGLEQYLTRVHRHLFYEEYYRREGQWPVEDAPHGGHPEGAHPIRSALMRKEERRWAS